MNILMLTIINCALAFATASPVETGERSVRPITTARSVFVIYTEDWSYVPQHDSKLIFGLWSDGHIVWSADQVRGGPPYRTGKVSSGDVERFFADVDHAGLFDEKRLPRSWVPVDSDFTSIVARWKGRKLLLRSRHEMDAIEGAPMDETRQFRRLRHVWEKLRRRSALLIPVNGVPVEGQLVLFHGDVTWHEHEE